MDGTCTMYTGRSRLPPSLAGLLRSELDVCMEEAGLTEHDRLIVTRCLLQHIPQMDVAIEPGLSRRTVGLHLAGAVARMEQAAKKLGLA